MDNINEKKSQINLEAIKCGFVAAIPVILGYVAIGIPCGILSQSIGMDWFQVLVLSILFYSGAGQFMIPNMYLAGANLFSIICSVGFVNTRQTLYSAALAPWCGGASKKVLFWYFYTVTDETFGIAISKFREGNWSVGKSIFLNEFSHLSWTLSCILGVFLGPIINIPLNIASFAMTSLFICLLASQVKTKPSIIAAIVAFIFVIIFKAIGLGGFAILCGAIVGVLAGIIFENNN